MLKFDLICQLIILRENAIFLKLYLDVRAKGIKFEFKDIIQ